MECRVNADRQFADFKARCERTIVSVGTAEGFGRGSGVRIECICKLSTPADSRSQPALTTRALPSQDASPEKLG
jgi:hypothetical protein